jgi:hypothetical protein
LEFVRKLDFDTLTERRVKPNDTEKIILVINLEYRQTNEQNQKQKKFIPKKPIGEKFRKAF